MSSEDNKAATGEKPTEEDGAKRAADDMDDDEDRVRI